MQILNWNWKNQNLAKFKSSKLKIMAEKTHRSQSASYTQETQIHFFFLVEGIHLHSFFRLRNYAPEKLHDLGRAIRLQITTEQILLITVYLPYVADIVAQTWFQNQ